MKIAVLDTSHPCRDEVQLKEFRALIEGGKPWRDLVTGWLPQNAVEPDELWKDRCSRAVYHNYVGGIVSTISGYLFAETPKVSGIDTPDWQAFVDNCDGAGTPWADWWRQAFIASLWGRDSWAWVNAPKRTPDVTYPSRKAEKDDGADALYLVPLSALDVLDWADDEKGNPVWVMFRQCESIRETPTSERKTVWTWTYIDGEVIRTWKWEPPPGQDRHYRADEEAVEQEKIEHHMGTFPCVRLRVPEILWAMALMRDPVLSHIRADNALTWALHRSAHAMPVITRKFGDATKPIIGAGYYWNLEVGEEVGFAEPEGKSFTVLAGRVQTEREEIFRVVSQMAQSIDNSASRLRASGDSKGMDWQATEVVTSAYASIVRVAMLEAARKVAEIMETADAAQVIQVTGLDGWQTEDLATLLANVSLATDANVMSLTFRKKVAEISAQRILGDNITADEMKTIVQEIGTYEIPIPAIGPDGKPLAAPDGMALTNETYQFGGGGPVKTRVETGKAAPK